ncbi:Isochorismatase hydrolase [Cutaneotrichosporon oleaginosum]|uniref:Isochorismatase hydrolase n=2 Tax=Cutaneotrichosporon oleaginosum TaxID=879819 RepID=A0A0J1BBX8_9TREE|nr:Isochorismatase hydrolase [Cutaneotrichosporon oleaginosum]KLT45514.1 Isochorismatase hydrolase [Cutaneotrichosporon oleaginosum]
MAAILEMKVITTEQNPKALGATVPELGIDKLPAHLNLGTHSKTLFSMFTPEVCKALGGRYANWHDASAVIDPEGIDRVIIVGIESHVCVFQTAMDAAGRNNGNGPRPIVLADAVSSINPQEIAVSLDRMRHSGVDVATSESVLFQLMGDASHPRFREFSKLVKEEKDNTSGTLQKMIGAVPI